MDIKDCKPVVLVPAGVTPWHLHRFKGKNKFLDLDIQGKSLLQWTLEAIVQAEGEFGDIYVWGQEKRLKDIETIVNQLRQELKDKGRNITVMPQQKQYQQGIYRALLRFLYDFSNNLGADMEPFVKKVEDINSITINHLMQYAEKYPELKEIGAYLILGDQPLLIKEEIEYVSKLFKGKDAASLFTTMKSFDKKIKKVGVNFDYTRNKMKFYPAIYQGKEEKIRFGNMFHGKFFKMDPSVMYIYDVIYENRQMTSFNKWKNILKIAIGTRGIINDISKYRGISYKEAKQIKNEALRLTLSMFDIGAHQEIGKIKETVTDILNVDYHPFVDGNPSGVFLDIDSLDAYRYVRDNFTKLKEIQLEWVKEIQKTTSHTNKPY